MSTATDMLALYLAAESDILTNGFSTRFGDRWRTMADLPQIRDGRREWQSVVDSETRTAQGGGGARFSVAGFSDD